MSCVLFLANHDVVIYNFRLELVEELLKQKHKVIISCPYGERIDGLVKLGAIHKNISINRHGMNPIHDFKLIQQYKKLIKEIKPDIIFSYTIKPNIYGAIAAKKYNVPFVANITGLGIAFHSSSLKKALCITLYKIAFKRIQRVFFQNLDNQQFFIKHKIAIGKHAILPGSGVNTDRYPYASLPCHDGFLFAARIMKDKGIDLFLKAAKRLKKSYPNVDFFVCGFCDDDNYIKVLSEYEKDGIIKYYGMVKNTIDFYSKASCVVLPSYHEGMSNTLLEAASCGRPIITSNIPGCMETVNDEKTGFLFECGNEGDLFNKMRNFLHLSYEDKKKMGNNAREKMKNEFDRNIVVKRYMEELNSLSKGEKYETVRKNN